MSRKKKSLIISLSVLFIIIGGSGSYILWRMWPATLSNDIPVLDFPIYSSTVIHSLGGFGEVFYGHHNGIDYGCNASVYVVAFCDLRVNSLKTWFNDGGGHWQTNVGLSYNWKYTFEVIFESWALNETYGNIQRESISVEIGQKISRGEFLGMLLYHGSGTHIHFGMKVSGESVCSYNYLSNDAKALFDSLWLKCGMGTVICNETVT